MAKRFLFIKLFYFVFVIFLANIQQYHCYVPPTATVEPLYPVGLRISVPDEQGMGLVAFHVKFNEDFTSLEAGQIARDIIKVRNGRWTYEDRQTTLRRDDIIYYWIHVVYNGLGYNLLDQSHRVVDFYNYDGTLHIREGIQTAQNCTASSPTWIFDGNGGRRQACPHQLLFEDNFDNINSTYWNSMQRFSGPPDYEFVVYMTNDTTDVSDGQLRIKPFLLEDKFGKNFVHRTLILESCTGNIDTEECKRQATGPYILPPIISGRIDTKGKFEFLFGRIEVRAKLPRGDWVYPLIILESTENTWEQGLHHEIRMASSPGNKELRNATGEDISGRVLSAGGLSLSLTETNILRTNRLSLPKRLSSSVWSNDYHIFEIQWKSGLIIVKVDGVQYGEQVVNTSFGKSSYLTLGLAVGGYREFSDLSTSTGYVKPWRNNEGKALHHFNEAKDQWYPTWDARTALHVDYVKVWAL